MNTPSGNGGWPGGPPPGSDQWRPSQQAGQWPPRQQGQQGQWDTNAAQWNPNHYPGGPPAAAPGAWQPSGQPAQIHDPRQALGEGPLPSVSIDSFRPPTNRTPMLVTIVALLVLAMVVVGGLYFQSAGRPAASPSPTPVVASRGPGQPFTTPDGKASGRWEIVTTKWSEGGLTTEIRIVADVGTVNYSFLAFANQGTDVVNPRQADLTPRINNGTLPSGESVQGFIFFPMARGDATIILATFGGRQMSALPVKG